MTSAPRQPRGTWGPSIEEFFACDKLVRVLIGGRGAAKSSALIDDICRHLWLNAGGKAILARQVDLSNLDSTIPTMLQWFKETGGPIYSPQGSGGLFKVWDGGRKVRVPSRLAIEEMGKVAGKLRTKGEVSRWIEDVGANMCGTIENRGLATEMAGGKLRGMECSYFAMVEADQIEERYFELCFACLRWKGADPLTCDEGGFIRDKSVVLDTNPPGTRHWIALMEKEEQAKPERERRMAFWHISTYENEHNLPPNYINDQILLPYGDNPAMIERMLWGRYSDAFSSAPVYYSFRRERHEAHGLKWPRGALCIVGMDVGTQNASTISAMKIHAGHLYFWTMREIILEESDTDRQCLALLKVLANQFPFWNSEGEICPHTYFFCDPAARNSSFTKAGANSSALKVMQSHGIFPGMKIAAHLQPTIAACNRLMQENHPVDDGELVWHFKIDADGCPDLFRGFQGLYRYAKVGESGYGSDLPVKGAACEGVDHVCFVAGTKVKTLRGEVGIETITKRDMVETSVGMRMVQQPISRSEPQEVWKIEFKEYAWQRRGGSIFRKTKCRKFSLIGTADHPIMWTYRQKTWVKLSEWKRYQTAVTDDRTVAYCSKKPVKLKRLRKVFNMQVMYQHDYFANGILVSNCDAWRYGLINAIEIARVGHPAGMTSAQKEANVDIEPKRR